MRKFPSDPTVLLTCFSVLGVAALLSAGIAPAFAATISRSADVKASASAVWSVIGPFCAIKNWLPPVGECIEDGKAPPTRVLLTRDGKAAFVGHRYDGLRLEWQLSEAFSTFDSRDTQVCA